MEFLGNKTSLLPAIREMVSQHASAGSTVADVFSGTATVSSALREDGYSVHANDLLPLCAMWASARLLVDPDPRFAGLEQLVGPLGGDPYATVRHQLSNLIPVEGWVASNYTPLSSRTQGVERRYLTVENGKAIDAARLQIQAWRNALTDSEHALLLASLVEGIVSVSNVAGTYGCYLKEWKGRALQRFSMVDIRPGTGTSVGHIVTCVDAEQAVSETQASLIYADPPYTKRQYAAYYHLLNSVVGDGDPIIKGSTGLPRWQEWSSEWCYSRRAPDALDRLVGKSSAPVFMLSYSSDGHISHDTILTTLTAYGRVEIREMERKRFKSSMRTHSATSVIERLYVMTRC